jgi:acyl-CoA synthetase (AMP-forming)/AMP-acid ligase II/aryl carrier-like protein
MQSSIYHLLAAQAQRLPAAEAILGLDRPALTYFKLLELAERTARALGGAGIRRGDRIGIVLPNGPEMATAFLSSACIATCAPLNPAYRAEEFDFYLSDLNAKAVLVLQGVESPVRAVAAERGIALLEVVPDAEAPAGWFHLAGLEPADSVVDFAGPEDVALVLHTSGTTSRPKIVPLTHRNLVISAENIRQTLRLEPADRCLNVMPLFHIHGLVGVILSSIAAGASVACAPGFQAPRFFAWFDHFRPTWYSAVPSIHQAILERASANEAVIRRSRLRLIRSSSSALPPPVMARLEEVFRAPVIEAYGMTEASHQMASNPLPPGVRKPGSVGLPTGIELAIMNEAGELLGPGVRGEVVIRGPSVTAGYENNPAANAAAFTGGWFRTGDQGYRDADGYLFLTGRLKEIINRGGEKISPREIDEVLLAHPAVAQALAFAVPDAKLGEEVAAAVVLRPGAPTPDVELREFASQHLADFKVPRLILILDEIPKGPTGKLQRIGLAEKLGLTSVDSKPPAPPRAFRPPRDETEAALCRMWEEILGIQPIGVEDDFFRLGGDSILAAQFLKRLREATGCELSMVRLFEAPTISAIARTIGALQPAD